MTELRKGIALLQREKYLHQQRSELMAAIQQHQPYLQGEQNSKCHDGRTAELIDDMEKVNAKILQVQNMCCAHDQRLRELWSTFRSSSSSRDVLMGLKPQYSLITGQKPYFWLKERNQCSDSGGCCGRECGCCEKPLKVIFAYVLPMLGLRRKKEVYGHCTAECGCCIRYKGSYKPDPLLENGTLEKGNLKNGKQ